MATQRMQRKYAFPTLKNAEIISCLKNSIAIAEEDLVKPSPQRVQAIYEFFLLQIVGISREVYTNSGGWKDAVAHPEIYAEAIAFLGFYRQVARLMNVVGIFDFSMRDLTKPEPARLKRIISAMINFMRYAEDQMGILEELELKAEDIKDQYEKTKDQHESLHIRLHNLSEQREREKPTLEQMHQQRADLHQQLRGLKKAQTALCIEVDALKARRIEVSDHVSVLEFRTQEMRKECENLESRVVHSPEKLKEVLTELNEQVVLAKQQLAENEGTLRSNRLLLERLMAVDDEIVQCVRQMQECQGERARADGLVRALRDDEQTASQRSKELHEIERKLANLQRQYDTTKGRMKGLQDEREEREHIYNNRKAELDSAWTRTGAERALVEERVHQLTTKAQEWEKEAATTRKKLDAWMAQVGDEVNKLSWQIGAYEAAMRTVMDATDANELDGDLDKFNLDA